MVQQKPFNEQVDELKEMIGSLQDDSTPEIREQTAVRLERLNYSPAVITPIQSFLRITKQGVLDEIDRIVSMPEQEACALAPGDTRKCEDLRLQFMKVILFYYEKLILLRKGDSEEWDEIDELYVHD
ncbi:MAG: hypothetical protein V2I36_02475 [Desulfopila sp.]|jgi:hypothetical protein|nr:hypothetical protein [Desulfopila sp.]